MGRDGPILVGPRGYVNKQLLLIELFRAYQSYIGRFSVVNAIDAHLRILMNSGLAKTRIIVILAQSLAESEEEVESRMFTPD